MSSFRILIPARPRARQADQTNGRVALSRGHYRNLVFVEHVSSMTAEQHNRKEGLTVQYSTVQYMLTAAKLSHGRQGRASRKLKRCMCDRPAGQPPVKASERQVDTTCSSCLQFHPTLATIPTRMKPGSLHGIEHFLASLACCMHLVQSPFPVRSTPKPSHFGPSPL